jgi:hypothetical protein
MNTQVDYYRDDEWNQWTNRGVKQLVLRTGNGTDVQDRANSMVALPTSPLNYAQHQSVAMPMDASDDPLESNGMQLQGSWDVIQDNELDASGAELLASIDWMEPEVYT